LRTKRSRLFQKNIDVKEFSKRLETLIKKSGLKQYQFADKCKITAAALSTYLNKERIPESEILQLIAEFGNTSMEWLLTGKSISDPVMENEDKFNNQVLKDMAQEIRTWRNKANEVETRLKATQEILEVMKSGGDYRSANPKKINKTETDLILNFQSLSEEGQRKALEYLSDQVMVLREE